MASIPPTPAASSVVMLGRIFMFGTVVDGVGYQPATFVVLCDERLKQVVLDRGDRAILRPNDPYDAPYVPCSYSNTVKANLQVMMSTDYSLVTDYSALTSVSDAEAGTPVMYLSTTDFDAFRALATTKLALADFLVQIGTVPAAI